MKTTNDCTFLLEQTLLTSKHDEAHTGKHDNQQWTVVDRKVQHVATLRVLQKRKQKQ